MGLVNFKCRLTSNCLIKIICYIFKNGVYSDFYVTQIAALIHKVNVNIIPHTRSFKPDFHDKIKLIHDKISPKENGKLTKGKSKLRRQVPIKEGQ